ncbi:MAG: hypothetical protein ABH871_04555 [Pseudomonadota bacterium]
MDFLDNLLQSFSAKDLRSRVTAVILAGFVICLIVACAMYFLLISEQQISISGVARWLPNDQNELDVSITQDDLAKLKDIELLKAELMDPVRGPVVISAQVLSINPAPPSITLDASRAPAAFRHLEMMDARLILIDKPMWQFLWGQ